MPNPVDFPEAAALTGWAGFVFGLSLFLAAIIFAACGSDLFLHGMRPEMLPFWFAIPTVPISGALLAALLRAAADVVRQLHRIADAQAPRKAPPSPAAQAYESANEPPPPPRG